MNSTPITANDLQRARERTEALLESCDLDDPTTTCDSAQLQALVTELRTHQEELQSQNDNLREVQDELLRTHNRFANLYEFAPICYLTVDGQGLITSANLRTSMLFDLERASLIGMPLKSFVRSADRATFESTLADVVKSHNSLDSSPECELQMVSVRGQPIHARLEFSASYDSDMPEARVALVDMTALRKAEQQLERYNEELADLVAKRTREKVALEHRLEQVAELSPDAIVLLDSHSRIRYASPALARMLGLAPRDLEDANLATWIHTRDWAAFCAHMQESGSLSNAPALTVRLVRPSERTLLWLELTSRPMPGESGADTPSMALIMRDVTERVLADRERDRLQEMLVDVTERRQQSAGTELHEDVAQTIAGSAMIAHKLVKDLVQADHAETDQAKYLVEVLTGVTNQVRQIATFLSPLIQPGGLTMSLERLAFQAREEWRLAVHLDLDESIEIDNETSAHLIWIAHEAVMNIGRHAQAKQMWLSWQRSEAGARLEIADDGIGVPQPLPKSHGIGFDVMRARANRIGFTLALESEAGHGTRVVVSGPVREV